MESYVADSGNWKRKKRERDGEREDEDVEDEEDEDEEDRQEEDEEGSHGEQVFSCRPYQHQKNL